VTGEFITVDPLYGGTSNPPTTGPGAGSGTQPVTIYQLALGAPTGIQFNSGDPAAGLNASGSSTDSNGSDTTGAVINPDAFGFPDLALAALSSINGLPVTNPGPPNPTYVGAGFFSPNYVSSSESPYAYVGGDPVDGIDTDGESPWGWVNQHVVQPTYHHVLLPVGHWASKKALHCVGDVVFSIGGGVATVVGTLVGATGIGFWPGVGLIVLGTGGVAYGVDGVVEGSCS